MKKYGKLLYIVLVAMLMALTLCLVGCGASGVDGTNGTDGKSAYELWLDNGHTGSQTDFLDWLKGKDGTDGKDGVDGENGKDGQNGVDGEQGEKGDKGNKGDKGVKGDKGENGADGQDGENGKSAYQIWLDNGNTGTEADFLAWLKGQNGADGNKGDKGDKGDKGENGTNGQDGQNGKSAFEIFLEYYPYYTGTEQDWINGLINGQLNDYTVTFKSEVSDDIVKRVFHGCDLIDVPEVPEKEGQASAAWDTTDFTNIQQDVTVNAVYVMQTKTVTFHNEFTDDEDIVKAVEYGQSITDVPAVTAKEDNDGYWSVSNFDCIKTDMTVNAVYETRGLQYTFINNEQSQYSVSMGEMNIATKELFIPPEHDGKPVTVIDENAFYDTGESLQFTFAYIPQSITVIGSVAFRYCRSLTSVTIESGVTSIGSGAFSGCSSLTSITIPNSVTSIGSQAFRDCSSLTNITILNGVTSIGDYVFWDCSGLTNVEIPNSVTSLGYRAFLNCSSLQFNEFDNALYLGNESNKYLCLMKAKDTSIVSCTIHENTKVIYTSAFANCADLTSIEIPNGITSIGYSAFDECSSLQFNEFDNALYLGNESNKYLCLMKAKDTSIASCTIHENTKIISPWAFRYCYSLKNIEIPNGVKIICDYVFSRSGITSIEIPNSVTSLGKAFSECNSLTSIKIGSGVTSIQDAAFNYCGNLANVVLPNSITRIGQYAFYDCKKLTNIVLPNSVTSIVRGAFSGCTLLSTIYYKGTREQFGKIQIGNDNAPFTDSTVYIYSENKPADDGFYWHYDIDGVTPVFWTKQNL